MVGVLGGSSVLTEDEVMGSLPKVLAVLVAVTGGGVSLQRWGWKTNRSICLFHWPVPEALPGKGTLSRSTISGSLIPSEGILTVSWPRASALPSVAMEEELVTGAP